MAKAFFSVDKNKVKNAKQFNGKFKHNHRLCNVENADPDKTHLNKELISLPEGENYYAAYKRIIKSLDYYKTHKPVETGKNASVKAFEVMLTYGKNDFPEDFDNLAWEKANVEWLQETFGKENVISATLHMDEATPHIHAMVVPIHEGKLNAKAVIGGPAGLLDKQESYSRAMQKLGLEARIKYSVARHENIMKFYSAVNDAVIERLPEPKKDISGKYTESMDEYFERANEFLVKRNLQNLKMQKDMEQKIVEAKSGNISNAVERNQYIEEIEQLRKIMIESIEKNERQKKILEQNAKKIQTIEMLNYALHNHPNEELVSRVEEDISELMHYAKEHINSIDLFSGKEFESLYDKQALKELGIDVA